MYVVGTAGHVDHGKSTLVQALTGIDPDRLQEEKDRGMTIDLGFAWLRLPGGLEVSIVDVPGHERFIKNMLAGVGGIDLALLVVAADEGVMPQTREHLAIVNLLGIQRGVVAITKCDLVDAEWLDLVVAEVEELLQGTTLAGAQLVPCSAVTREGLPEMLQAIEQTLTQAPPKRDIGRPRLWIDRAFTISGFGSVVTGTLIDGTLRSGEEVELLPDHRRTRIRGLQTHRKGVARAEPGTRTAVNLAGVSADELQRGMMLTEPGWLQPTTAADVRLQAVQGMPRPIKHNASVTFHSGSAEVPAKLRLLDRAELAPGQSCWAQVRLTQPLPLIKGDSFVVRTPNDTIGGGAVVDSHPKRHRRHHEPTLAALETLDHGSTADALLNLLSKLEPADLGAVMRETDLSAETARENMQALIADGRVIEIGDAGSLYTAEGYHRVLSNAHRLLNAYFTERPLRAGMPREELRSRLGIGAKLFNDLLPRWIAEGEVIESRAALDLPGREITLSPAQQREMDEYLALLAATPFAPPVDRPPNTELLAYLVDRSLVVALSEDIVFSNQAYQDASARIVGHLREHESITLAQVRDLLGTSRRFAQALLEYLDQTRVTRRIGDDRVLRSTEASHR
jgi:selenocysteine-specific elongation factor